MSRGSNRGRGVQSRRKTAWDVGPGDDSVTAVTVSARHFMGNVIVPNIDGLTIVRTRGLFTGRLIVAAAAGDGFIGWFGIGTASDQAVAGGVTTVPSPFTDIGNENWLYIRPVVLLCGDATAGSRNWDMCGGTSFEVDSKAMRKIDEGDSVYAMLHLTRIGGGTEGDFTFDSRVLLKLP